MLACWVRGGGAGGLVSGIFLQNKKNTLAIAPGQQCSDIPPVCPEKAHIILDVKALGCFPLSLLI